MTEDIVKIEDAIEQAREDLQQILEKVHQEVEEVGARFSFENLVHRNPRAAACGAVTAGLLIGTHYGRQNRSTLSVLAIGFFLSLAIWEFSPRNGRND